MNPDSPALPTWEQTQQWLLTDGARILLTIVIAMTALWALRRVIDRVVATMTSRSARRLAESGRAGRVLASATGLDNERQRQRVETVGSLLRSVVTLTVATLAILTIMALLGIPLGPLLASAGVAGVALGFGAQSLVKDFLSGVFMIIEDQYGVGDIIDAGPATGTVERVTLRSTQLRDLAGTVWHIPNGTITRVGNKSQNWARAVVEVVLSHDADVRAARAELRRVADAMAGEEPWAAAMRTGAEADEQGISALTPAGVTLRLVVDTEPKSQWQVERELRLRIKEAFDAAGIPFEVHHP